MAGVSLSSGILRTLVALKLGLLGFLIAWGLILGGVTGPISSRSGLSVQDHDPLLPALAIAWSGAFIAFAGWWDVSKLAGELRDPERDLPRALILGVSIV